MRSEKSQRRLAWALDFLRQELPEESLDLAEEILWEYERSLWDYGLAGDEDSFRGTLQDEDEKLWYHQRFSDRFDPHETHVDTSEPIAQTSTRRYLDSSARAPFLDWLLIDSLIWNELQMTSEALYGIRGMRDDSLKDLDYFKRRSPISAKKKLPGGVSWLTLLTGLAFVICVVYPVVTPWVPFIALTLLSGFDLARTYLTLELMKGLNACKEAYSLLAPSPQPANSETLLAAVIASRASGGKIDTLAIELLQDVSTRGGKIRTLWE